MANNKNKSTSQARLLRRKRIDRWIREVSLANWLRLYELWHQLYRNGILVVAFAMFVFAFIGAWIGLTFERLESGSLIHDLPEALWWAVVTMTTTGYGDVVPKTWLGRGAGVLLMFGGIALVAVFSATISSVFIVLRLREGRGLRKVLWTDHILICGWNSIAEKLLNTLELTTDRKIRVVLINQLNPDDVQDLTARHPGLKMTFVHGDDTQEETLKRANVAEAATIVLLARDEQGDDRQIMVALAARALNKNATIYAQVSEEKNIYHLKRAGVDEVVNVAPYAGFLLAAHTLSPGIPRVYDELLNPNNKHSFIRVPISSSWFGKTFGEFSADYRRNTGGMIVGLIQETSILSAVDILSHDSASIDEFIRRKFIEAGLTPTELEQEQVRLNPADDTVLRQHDIAVALPGRSSKGA